jgi:hypothetical protein
VVIVSHYWTIDPTSRAWRPAQPAICTLDGTTLLDGIPDRGISYLARFMQVGQFRQLFYQAKLANNLVINLLGRRAVGSDDTINAIPPNPTNPPTQPEDICVKFGDLVSDEERFL